MLSRNDKILSQISRDQKILEIGPSYSPIVVREDGWNIFTLDHMDAESLRVKYKDHDNVDVGRIQEVDFVWTSGHLHDAVPSHHWGTFDGIIASHMIEHVPDLVGFFNSISKLLKPGGILSLVVPDKRFCFDYYQPISMTGDVLVAHRQGRTRHSHGSVFNASAYTARNGQEISWGQHPTALMSLWHTDPQHAYERFMEYRDGPDDPYTDVHGWYFTSSSFLLIALELRLLGLIDFREEKFFDTNGCEFFVSLSKTGVSGVDSKEERAGLLFKRAHLLNQILLDIRRQTDYLIEGASYLGR